MLSEVVPGVASTGGVALGENPLVSTPPIPPPPGERPLAPPKPEPPPRRRLRTVVLAILGVTVLAAAVVVAVAVLSSNQEPVSGSGVRASASAQPSQTQEGHTLTGTLYAGECGGGYDIKNASVTIRDENDTVIGAGTTSPVDSLDGFGCEVAFSIGGLPDAEFYQLEIGTHGAPSYTLAELEGAGWHIELSLD